MLYAGACLLTGFYYDVKIAVLSNLMFLITELFQFLVARRALRNPDADEPEVRRLNRWLFITGIVNVLSILVAANLVALVNPSEYQTLPLIFLLAAALYVANRNHHLIETMIARLLILGLAMVMVAAQDIVLLRPSLDSPIWMQFIAVCFTLYLIADCAMRSRDSYVCRYEQMSELRAARDAARQAHTDKNATIAALTHDLRTPLNAMLGTAQLLDMTDLSLKQSEYANTIISAGWYLNTLLSDILDAEKLAAGKMSIHPIESDPCALLQEVLTLHRGAARAKGIELILDVDPQMPDLVMFDPVRVMQAVNNLASNAIKFTAEGQVLIRARCAAAPDGVSLEISVQDTGIGITPEDAAQLFKPFAQAGAGSDFSNNGSGLGLWISRSLMEAMDGDVSLESVPGEGSTFTLHFVAGAVEAQAPELAIAV